MFHMSHHGTRNTPVGLYQSQVDSVFEVCKYHTRTLLLDERRGWARDPAEPDAGDNQGPAETVDLTRIGTGSTPGARACGGACVRVCIRWCAP